MSARDQKHGRHGKHADGADNFSFSAGMGWIGGHGWHGWVFGVVLFPITQQQAEWVENYKAGAA